MTPCVVLLGGPTASGKSTLAEHLAGSRPAVRLSHDRYYFDVAQPEGHNYDHPDALDTDRLVRDVDDLRAGRAALVPRYEFSTHSRLPQPERIAPQPLVLVEGILVLADPRLRQRAHLRVYVDAPADLRLVRRIRRDVVRRGREVDSVLRQYLDTVRPMHHQFVAPSRAGADLVLDGTLPVERLVAMVEARLSAL